MPSAPDPLSAQSVRGDIGTALGILANIRDDAKIAREDYGMGDDVHDELRRIYEDAVRGVELLRPYLNGPAALMRSATMPEYVTCGACGGELDGTWTCPNDCLEPLTDEEVAAMSTYQVTREVSPALSAASRNKQHSEEGR